MTANQPEIEQSLTVRYSQSENAPLDLRELGLSLTGIERIINVGIYALETGKTTRSNAALPLKVITSHARTGSLEFDLIIHPGLGFLPMLHEAFLAPNSKLIWYWLQAVFMRASGRQQESNQAFDKMMDLMKVTEEHRHEEMINLQNLLSYTTDSVSTIRCN